MHSINEEAKEYSAEPQPTSPPAATTDSNSSRASLRPKPTLKPLLQYFTLPNPAAEEEYTHLAAPAITSFLQEKGYTKYSVGMMHVGFDRGNALPSVLVTAMFSKEDVLELRGVFNGLKCKVLRRIYFYTG